MRYLISTICIALLLWGCDNTTADSPKPTVVRKKIVAPKGSTAKARTKKAVRTAKTKPRTKQKTKTVVAKVDKPKARATKKPAARPSLKMENGSKSPLTKQTATAPPPKKKPAAEKKKKPAISPKSEITEIKQADNTRQQPGKQPGKSDTVVGKKSSDANDSSSVIASYNTSDGIPPVYDATGKIDPFDPPFRVHSGVAKKTRKKIKRVPRTPLERIDLAQLKLVGIILASSGNRALVEESSGKGYVIKKGTYIGTNGGKIVKIQKEAVYVEEKFEDVFRQNSNP